MTPTVGVVVLTQNKRPAELHRAVDSVLAQRGVDVDVVVVGNGAEPEGLPGAARVLALPENLGIPAGRNAGIGEVAGELLCFLDDDAYLAGEDFLARAAELFEARPRLGIAQPRVADPDGAATPRRFVPRLRVGDPAESGEVVALWEGACVARRAALDAAGAWPAEFGYMHEGIDLAWRVMDAGYTVRYSTELIAGHAAVPAERHAAGRYHGARNRVWLARRNLPAALALPYLATWFAADTLRLRSRAAAIEHARGYRDGLVLPCGDRKPMSWHTAWRMTRLGRPPVV
jgi:GT2 family glycosyltransferase